MNSSNRRVRSSLRSQLRGRVCDAMGNAPRGGREGEGREVTGHILGSAGSSARRKCFLTRCGGSAICKVRTAGVKRGPLSVCLRYMKSEDLMREKRGHRMQSGVRPQGLLRRRENRQMTSRLPVRDIQLDLGPLAPETGKAVVESVNW